jgi:hypothetical protein
MELIVSSTARIPDGIRMVRPSKLMINAAQSDFRQNLVNWIRKGQPSDCFSYSRGLLSTDRESQGCMVGIRHHSYLWVRQTILRQYTHDCFYNCQVELRNCDSEGRDSSI